MKTWKAVTATPTIKADDTDNGARSVSAVFATLNVEDSQGDVILPGHLGTQEVAMVWHHDWTRPIGKGVISETGSLAIFEGTFLNTADADEAYETVKQMGTLQEWSFGFWSHPESVEWKETPEKVIRILGPMPDGTPGADVAEVSPVLRGAGVGTRTLAIKQTDGDHPLSVTVDEPTGQIHLHAGPTLVAVYDATPTGLKARLRLQDDLTCASRAVEQVVERLHELVSLRAEQSRTIGAETMDHASRLADTLETAVGKIRTVTSDTPDPATLEMWKGLLVEQGRRLGWNIPTT